MWLPSLREPSSRPSLHASLADLPRDVQPTTPAARSSVIFSGSSARRSEAFVSPSVTYGPKRPSFNVIIAFVAGSSPISAGSSSLATTLFRLRQRCQRAGEVDGQDAGLVRQGTRLFVPRDVGTVAAIAGDDVLAILWVLADDTRNRQQLERIVECHVVQIHVLKRLAVRGFTLDFAVFFFGLASGSAAAASSSSGRTSVT